MATAAAVSGVSCAPAFAFDIDHNTDLITDTVAGQQRRVDWNAAEKFGARNVGAADRGFAAPEGIRVGNFFFYPSLGETIAYDSNIYGLAKDPVPDWRFITAPTLKIESQLPRHAFDMTVFGRFVNFAEHSDQDYVDFGGRARGAIHIDHAHTLSASVLATRENEERSASTAAPTAAEPVPIDRFRGSIGITRDVGRLYGTLAATAEHLDYGSVPALDGTTLDQDYRDQTLYSTQLRTGYRFSPGFDLVTRLRAMRQYNDGETPTSGNRNSTGYEAAAGLAFESDALLRWRLLGGYGVRDYDRADLATVNSALLEAQVEWLATDRLTLFAHAGRALVDEIGANDNGRIETTAGARAAYEIRHDLVASVNLEFADLQFNGSQREDRILEAGVGLEYFYTKNWQFSLGYTFEHRQSNEAEFDFDRSLARVGAKLKF
jgi:hypothetical protein